MDMTEKTLDQRYRFHGRIINVRVDTVMLPNGKEALREVCEHPGGVGVLAIDSEGMIILVRQFRYPYAQTMLEIPAGKLDHGPEGHLAGGVRELQEETGYRAERMVYMGASYPSPGFMTEVLHLYCATGLTAGESSPDEDEFVELVRMPVRELEQRIADGEIQDGKTMIAMYKARLLGFFDGL